MFFNGITTTPPVIPTEYNLSTGCTPDAIVPTTEIVVGDITLCGIGYSIQQQFSAQADLITFLNTTFLPAFGLSGSFSIVTNQLIYTTGDECVGINCIQILNKEFEEGDFFYFEEDDPYEFED